jgi:hypothetical protein
MYMYTHTKFSICLVGGKKHWKKNVDHLLMPNLLGKILKFSGFVLVWFKDSLTSLKFGM